LDLRPIVALGVWIAFAGGQLSGVPAPPRLEIDAPWDLAQARARLESFDPQRLAGIVPFVGLTEAGPPIHVVLASETSNTARDVPEWIAGLALGRTGVVVLFPDRAPVYPHDTLEDVLRHEVAHVLIGRAAGGRPVPRWFHEGVAMAAEQPWGLEDRTRLMYELALGPRTAVEELDRLFAGSRREQTRAYVLAGAFVRDLLDRAGFTAPAEILRRVARDARFEAAFANVAGVTVFDAEERFWRRQRLWSTWVPLLTSTTAVWMLVTLLALFAIRKRRQKSAALRRRWNEEESDEPDPWPGHEWTDD
jgi:hypothetical protein